MKTRMRHLPVLLLLLVAVTAVADEETPGVPGILGMTPVEEGACMAVFIPVPEGYALSGVMWYNNDQQVVFPEVLVASGVPDHPEPVAAAFPVAQDVSGLSSAWSELTFSEPVAAAGDGYFLVFRLPADSEYTADGPGGGAGIGYTVGANGYTGWMSSDGVEWDKLHDDFGMAIQPITVVEDESMVQKSIAGDETPVTHTALLAPAPNPFNPQTELHFQLKDASDVDLSIYNVRGARVVQLVHGPYPYGRFRATWRGTDSGGRRVASGAYFARFAAGDVVQTQRLLLVK